MKKKLAIYYGILIAFILILFLSLFLFIFKLASAEKEAIGEQDFINKAAILNAEAGNLELKFKITDKSDQSTKEAQDLLKKHIVKSLAAENNELILRYFKFTDEKMAYFMYAQEQKGTVKSNQNEESSNSVIKIESPYLFQWNGKNFNIKETKTEAGYFAFIRIENTYLTITSLNDEVFSNALNVFLGLKPFTGGIDAAEILGIILTTFILIFLVIIYYLIPRAYIFKKAGIHPIIAFVPYVSQYFLCKLADKNGWKMLFLFIPFINIVYKIILSLRIAKVFNKSELFGAGIFFMPIIFLPIIAFDESCKYTPDFSSDNKI